MIVLGIIALVLGVIFAIHILWIIGIALIVIGIILALIGGFWHPVGGRRHWY